MPARRTYSPQGQVYARPIKPFREPQPSSLLAHVLIAVWGGIFLFIVALILIYLAYGITYARRIFPGVSMAGVDLSGLSKEQARLHLAENLRFAEEGMIGLRDKERNWIVKPGELGLTHDIDGSVTAAMQWGRKNGIFSQFAEQLQAWHSGADLAPIYVFDERQAQNFLSQIEKEIRVPVRDAALEVQGTGIIVRPAQEGRSLDMPASLKALRNTLIAQQTGFVDLVITSIHPTIVDVTKEAETARSILSAPLMLTIPNPLPDDPPPWRVEVNDLARMIRVERTDNGQGDNYSLNLDVEVLRPLVQNAAEKLARSPQDARFTFNDETRELEVFQTALIGRSLSVEKTLTTIREILLDGKHSAALVFDSINPQHLDKVSAMDMGITELVGSQTTYFYGSDAGRIQNITAAAARFHGVLVAPWQTFSMAALMGDVSLDTGFAEAWIIYGDRTIKGVGGGVCQVSTTLFRTVFFAGYPIVERHPHAYRVAYYEYNASGGIDEHKAGLDATVFLPLVDFKFKNDTPSWILMETYVNAAARTLTWKLYSTSDGRQVEWESSGLLNVVEPPETRYIENPELETDEIKQTDWAIEGADVEITRKVTKDGAVLYDDRYTTHYLPWGDVYEYGPGTVLPEEEEEPQPEE